MRSRRPPCGRGLLLDQRGDAYPERVGSGPLDRRERDDVALGDVPARPPPPGRRRSGASWRQLVDLGGRHQHRADRAPPGTRAPRRSLSGGSWRASTISTTATSPSRSRRYSSIIVRPAIALRLRGPWRTRSPEGRRSAAAAGERRASPAAGSGRTAAPASGRGWRRRAPGRSRRTSAFSIDDLPTLLRPTNAISGSGSAGHSARRVAVLRNSAESTFATRAHYNASLAGKCSPCASSASPAGSPPARAPSRRRCGPSASPSSTPTSWRGPRSAGHAAGWPQWRRRSARACSGPTASSTAGGMAAHVFGDRGGAGAPGGGGAPGGPRPVPSASWRGSRRRARARRSTTSRSCSRTGLEGQVDLAVVVWAPREVQIARLVPRDAALAGRGGGAPGGAAARRRQGRPGRRGGGERRRPGRRWRQRRRACSPTSGAGSPGGFPTTAPARY